MKQTLRFFILTAFAAASVTAQRTGTPLGGTTSTGGNSTGQPSTLPGSNTTPGLGDNPEATIPIFLSGKVVIDDGSPTPQNIAIQRLCGSVPQTVAWTDGKGRFNFQWGDRNSTIVPDASEPGNGMGRMDGKMGSGSRGQIGRLGADPLAGCELRASVVGFRSDRINLSGHRALDNADIGTIFLHRLANVEGTSVSATALNAPKDAVKAYDKGTQSLHKMKLDDAAKDFEKAVQIYPKYANAWLDLGRVQLQQKMTDAARESFKKATEADAKMVDAWAELGQLAAQSANWPDAAQYLDRALKLDPVDYPQLWYADAVAGYNVKNLDVAERSAREALKADPEHRNPKADQLLGNVLLQKGEYAAAGEELRAYLKFSPNAGDLDQVKNQLAQIDSMVNGTTPPKQP
jgi:tetratricopeptide (TPR) repeat protein